MKDKLVKKYDLIHTESLSKEPGSPHQLGKSKDGKWYGWSHRAVHGFKSKRQARNFARSVS